MKIKQGLENEYANYKEKNNDPYGKCVVDCSEIFGSLVDEGKTFDEAETKMFENPVAEGITGFMMGALISGVCHFHPKGDEIKVWWNKRSDGTPDEDGVNNPAILTM